MLGEQNSKFRYQNIILRLSSSIRIFSEFSIFCETRYISDETASTGDILSEPSPQQVAGQSVAAHYVSNFHWTTTVTLSNTHKLAGLTPLLKVEIVCVHTIFRTVRVVCNVG